MKRLMRGHKGFTLIELMVVIAVLAILAAIVAGGVQGGRSASEDSRAQSDASTVEGGIKKFQNEDLTQAFPEVVLTLDTGADAVSAADDFYKATVNSGQDIKIPKAATGSVVTNLVTTTPAVGKYMALVWNATAQVRVATGGTTTANFVDAFVPRESESAILTRNVTIGSVAFTGVNEYLWVLKVSTAFDPEWNSLPIRQLEIWKLNDAGTGYAQLYP